MYRVKMKKNNEKLQNIFVFLVDIFMMKVLEILIHELNLEPNSRIFQMIGIVLYVEYENLILNHIMRRVIPCFDDIYQK